MEKRKINWWIDPFMIPFAGSAGLIHYIWLSLKAGWVYSEYIFDPDAFLKLYNDGNSF